MADVKKLAKFTVLEVDQAFSLHIEDEAGDVLELSATRDQIDIIVDRLDEILSQDDSADEIDGDEDEVKGGGDAQMR